MSRLSVDPATLDAMVLDTEDSAWAWERLVSSAGGLSAWQTAVQQREHVDQFAQRIRESPWLAKVLLHLRRVGRTLLVPSGSILHVWEGNTLLAETLGGETAQPATPITLSWGQVLSVKVAVGRSICLQPSSAAESIAVFAFSKGVEQALPQCEWTLETEEAPVLLIGCLTDHSAPTLLETLPRSRSFAGILLEETT